MSERTRPRGLVTRFVESGWLEQLGLDAVILVGLVLIGIGLYRLQPEAVWIYAGVVCIAASVLIARTRQVKPAVEDES